MLNKLIQALVVSLALLLMACAPSNDIPENAVAVFEGGAILQPDLDAMILAQGRRYQDAGGDVTSPEFSETLIKTAAWHKIVTERWRDEIVNSESWPHKTRLLEYRIWFARLEELISNEVEVDEELATAELERIVKTSENRESIDLRHIFFRADPTMSAAARAAKLEQARSVLALAERGENFEVLARQYSDSETGANGGLIRAVVRGLMDETFEDAAFALQPTEISGVVETRNGFHIITVEERFQSPPVDREALKPGVYKRLKAAATEAEIQSVLTDLREQGEFDAFWSSEGDLQPRSDGVVLEVGDFRLTMTDVEKMQDSFPEGSGADLARMLDGVLEQELLLTEARSRLASEAGKISEVLQLVEEQELTKLALAKETRSMNAAVASSELQRFADTHPRRLEVPGRSRPQVLLLPFDKNPFDTQIKAEELVERARGGEDFSNLVRQYSQGPLAESGGDLGLIRIEKLGEYGVAFAKTVARMEQGQISEPVRITDRVLGLGPKAIKPGILIVHLIEREANRSLILPDDEEEIRRIYWKLAGDKITKEKRDQDLASVGFRLMESQ